jgi:ABC-type xylose transport system permease subunit
VKFLKSAASQVIGLFVSDWVQTAVIVAIIVAAWYAISGLHATPLPVLIVLVVLLAAQHVWFALAEARRAARTKPLPSPSPH